MGLGQVRAVCLMMGETRPFRGLGQISYEGLCTLVLLNLWEFNVVDLVFCMDISTFSPLDVNRDSFVLAVYLESHLGWAANGS